MTASTASMGHQSRLGVKEESSYGTAVVVDRGLIFVSESLAKRGVILERDGLRGTRSHASDDTRTGPYSVGGTIVLEPTPEDLAVLLPWILGADVWGTTYALAETLQSFTVTVDRVADRFTYPGCVVSRATFSGAKGGYMRLALDVVAQKEGKMINSSFSEGMSGPADAYPPLTPSVTTPFIFNGDLTLTLQSTARECDSFELVIDNSVVADRFFNSSTIINAPPGDRLVTLRTVHPWASVNSDLYGQALAGAGGMLALATGNYSMTCTFGRLQVPDNSPTVGGRGEVLLNLDMVARSVSTTKEISIDLDSTG